MPMMDPMLLMIPMLWIFYVNNDDDDGHDSLSEPRMTKTVIPGRPLFSVPFFTLFATDDDAE